MNSVTKTAIFALLVATTTAWSPLAASALEVPVATWGSPNHINIVTFVGKLTECVADKAGKSITIHQYPSGELANDADMPVAIPAGTVKFGWVTLNGWSGLIPDAKVADAPEGLTMKQLEEATDRPDGLKAVLNKEMRAKGATLLAVTPLGPTVFVTNKPVKAPSDFKGMKIRVYSAGTAALVEALGAAPVQLPFGEVYTALQRGTIDGAVTGFQGVGSQKMYEVAKYLLIPASFTGAGGYMGWVANSAWWDGLPDKDRTILSGCIRKAELYSRAKIIEDRNKLAGEYRKKGMKVIDLTPAMPEYAKWVKATAPLLKAAEKELSPAILAPIKAVKAKAN